MQVIILICNICPRNCRAERNISPGFCGVGESFRVARAAPHFWEEPPISGVNGSGTVFFSGCNLRCVFCQNHNISSGCFGKDVTPAQLMKIFDNLVSKGVHNLNLVTPSHFVPMLSKVLKEYHSPIPVVYNTSSYEKTETLRMLEGLVDIYLPDIKYFDDSPAVKYSSAPGYFKISFEAVKEMYRQVGNLCVNGEGIAERGVLIRHMVLPGNISQAVSIFSRVLDEFGSDAYISIMRQYIPCGTAVKMPPIDRPLSSREYKIVTDKIFSLGFNNVFLQSKASSSEIFIPDFDLEGVDIF